MKSLALFGLLSLSLPAFGQDFVGEPEALPVHDGAVRTAPDTEPIEVSGGVWLNQSSSIILYTALTASEAKLSVYRLAMLGLAFLLALSIASTVVVARSLVRPAGAPPRGEF